MRPAVPVRGTEQHNRERHFCESIGTTIRVRRSGEQSHNENTSGEHKGTWPGGARHNRTDRCSKYVPVKRSSETESAVRSEEDCEMTRVVIGAQ
jgi:hypothetical protein